MRPPSYRTPEEIVKDYCLEEALKTRATAGRIKLLYANEKPYTHEQLMNLGSTRLHPPAQPTIVLPQDNLTTEIIKSCSARLPAPDRYAAHVDRVLGDDTPETSPWAIGLVVSVYVFLILFGLSLP